MDIIMKSISAIESYAPTTYKNNSEPDLDEDNLNKTEQALKRVTDAVNEAINALKQLEQEKISVSDISNVQLNDPSKVPSSALAYAMKEEMNAVNNNKIENLKWTQTVDYVNNFRLPGIAFFMIDAAVAQKIDLPGTSWWYVMHISKTDGSGFAVQIFYELGGQGQTCRRWSSDTSWIGRSW